MERFLAYIPKIEYHSQQVVSEIKDRLCSNDVECIDYPDNRLKTAIVIWEENILADIIFETIGDLCSHNYKTIIVNLNETTPDHVKWQLMLAGANDIIDWENGEAAIKIIRARLNRWKEIAELLQSQPVKAKMIGESDIWKTFLERIIEAAYFTKNNILLMGESGTGKELTAGLIHEIDHRKEKGELVLLDCTTIVPELFGSEFYGHEKGAFTSGVYSRDGAFALANGGSLFLDELGELPITLQAGLLRVIQERTYKRVGSNTWHKTSFRLISATNKDLKKQIGLGRFREDLYYRIASAVFTIPSLQERREDIPELVRHFLREELKMIAAPKIDMAAMNYLVARDYPGNVRELKQLVARIAMRYTGEDVITLGDIPEDELPEFENQKAAWNKSNLSIQQAIRLAISSGKDLAKIKTEIANLALEIALEECNGNLKFAARKLNVEVRTLQYIRKKNNHDAPK